MNQKLREAYSVNYACGLGLGIMLSLIALWMAYGLWVNPAGWPKGSADAIGIIGVIGGVMLGFGIHAYYLHRHTVYQYRWASHDDEDDIEDEYSDETLEELK